MLSHYLPGAIFQDPVERIPHVFPGNDQVYKTVIQQVFGGLEAIGKLLFDGFFNDAATGKADKGFGFGDVNVAHHGEAGGNAPCGGIGHNGNIGYIIFPQAGKNRTGFRHLHQGNDAFVHPSTP